MKQKKNDFISIMKIKTKYEKKVEDIYLNIFRNEIRKT
jgi:hypothetical protein